MGHDTASPLFSSSSPKNKTKYCPFGLLVVTVIKKTNILELSLS